MKRPIALTALSGMVLLAGCTMPAGQASDTLDQGSGSSGSTIAYSGNTDPAHSGTVGLSLTLPDGEHISTVQWAISGPAGAATVVASGSIDVHASAATSFSVPLIAAGSGYRVALSAISADAGATCVGTANFNVQVHQITAVAVQMACSLANAGGHTTLVNGTGFDCAAWTSVSATPVSVSVGGQVSLSAMATGPVPENVTYAWTAPSGQFGSANAADSTFTCTDPGTVPITLTVADGPVPMGSTCNPALSTDVVMVTCSGTAPPPPPPAAPALPGWALLLLAGGLAMAGRAASRLPEAGGLA